PADSLPTDASDRATSPLFLFLLPATAASSSFSLHGALPISAGRQAGPDARDAWHVVGRGRGEAVGLAADDAHRANVWRAAREDADRKSTRLNSIHVKSSYAVLSLQKKRITVDTALVASIVRQ